MTPDAILLGLKGDDPETMDIGCLGKVKQEIRQSGQIALEREHGQTHVVKMDLGKDLASPLARSLAAKLNG